MFQQQQYVNMMQYGMQDLTGMQPVMMQGGVQYPFMYYQMPGMMPMQPFVPVMSPLDSLQQQKAQIGAELDFIKFEEEKVRKVARAEGANFELQHTDELISKQDPDGPQPRKKARDGQQTHAEVMDSIQRLDELLLKKKTAIQGPIPFITSYTPVRKSGKMQQEITRNQEDEHDSLEDDNRYIDEDLSQKEGYLGRMHRIQEQKFTKDSKLKPTSSTVDESKPSEKNVVVQTEHGVLKVANKDQLNDLFS